jgi:hypothetical protein
MAKRDREIIELKIKYNEKLINELLLNGGDEMLIEKYRKNIKSYKNELKE